MTKRADNQHALVRTHVDDPPPKALRGVTQLQPTYDPRAYGAMCDICPLKGHVVVPPTKSRTNRLAIVGEAPGRVETFKGVGFCLVPSTLVLMANLTWRPLGEIVIGDEIIAVDEEPPLSAGASGRAARQWKTATVTAKYTRVAECYRVETEAGELIGTGEHRVMTAHRKKGDGGEVRFGRNWQRIDDLVCGAERKSRIVNIGIQPWSALETYDAGWLAGFLDGEGHVLGSKSDRVKRAGRVGFTQNEGAALERARAIVGALGFGMQAAHKHRPYKSGTRKCTSINIAGDIPEMMKFLGLVGPVRLIDDFKTVLSRKGTRPSTRNLSAAKVTARYKVGKHEVIDITTTAGTFIANGFVVHNCGPSGRLLDQHLEKAEFNRDDAHITNSLLCRPDDEKEIPGAMACCAPRLARELSKLPKKTPILALGSVSVRSILGVRSILMARGFVWTAPKIDEKKVRAFAKLAEKRKLEGDVKKSVIAGLAAIALGARLEYEGRTVIPSIHPAFVLRADTWGPVLAADVDRAIRWSRGDVDLKDHGEHVIVRRPSEVAAAFAKLKRIIAVDIEADGPHMMASRLLCIGASDGVHTLVIHPFEGEAARRLSGRGIRRVWQPFAAAITRAFRMKTLVGHNFINFDKPFMQRYGIHFDEVRIEDTLIAHHAFASHLPQRLDHVVSVFVDASPWKMLNGKRGGAEEKGLAPWEKGGDELTYYNASDCRVTAHAWHNMQPDLDDERKVYEHDMKLAEICAKMQIAGFKMDLGRRDELSKTIRHRAAALLGEMRKIAGPNFHPARPSEVRGILFGKLKAKAFDITKTGLPSTSSGTLEHLRVSGTRAATMADLIIRWRDAAKTRSTFLDGIPVHTDGRVHPNWRAYGTVTGRLGCRGPNLMNLPRPTPQKDGSIDITRSVMSLLPSFCGSIDITDRVRECFVAARGCKLVYFDLSQAEMRFAAHLSGDEAFIETCKGDVHAGNAMVLFPDAREILKTDPKGRGKKFRDIAKNAGFAVTYLAEAETVFAYLNSKGFSVSLSDVHAMLDRMKSTYRDYYRYVEGNVNFCRKHGYLRTAMLGRIRWMGWYPKPTEVANYPIQSGIADLMNSRLIDFVPRLPEGARIVAQIHDAAIFECKNAVVDRVAALIDDLWKAPVVLPSSKQSFRMPIDKKIGERWSDFA